MSLDTPVNNLVRNLRSVGLRPDQRLVDQIVAQGAEAVEPLLEMALDIERLGQDEPGSLGPVHALRLLGQIRATEAAKPILGALPLPQDLPPTQAVYIWEQEAPQIVARLGADVLPTVLDIADDDNANIDRRGAAFEALAYMSATEPELRDEIVQHFRTRFEQADNPRLRAYIVRGLADLGISDMYSQIMAAFREGSIDRDIITAADARQMLLGAKENRRIECANHTLDERYEQHGPYSEEQRRAMAEMQQQMYGR